MRFPVEDADLVARAELIVVGHPNPNAITYVPHEPSRPGDGRSHEHHAVLIVTQTLKGTLPKGDLSIIIRYGLDPMIERKPAAGRLSRWRFWDDPKQRFEG